MRGGMFFCFSLFGVFGAACSRHGNGKLGFGVLRFGDLRFGDLRNNGDLGVLSFRAFWRVWGVE